MSQLVIFGAARIDAYMNLPDEQADTLCNLDTRQCVLQLSYAAKIPMRSVDFLLGGNGANVAVGVRRMGVESLLVADVGDDVMGKVVKHQLEAENVDTSCVTQTQGVPAGFGAVINYQDERTILSYYPPTEPPFPNLDFDGQWAYLTSVGDVFETFYEKTLSWINSKNPRVIFNPGGRQISKGSQWLAPYLQKTEILIANREECQDIAGMPDTHGREKELMQNLLSMGPKKVVVTDGKSGSFSFDGERFCHLGILEVDAVERTGAGDATSTGIIAALLKDKPLDQAMLWGMLNSTSVIGYIGPQRGLLREDEIDSWIQRAENAGVKIKEI